MLPNGGMKTLYVWAAAGCSGSTAEASTKAKRKLEVKQFQGIRWHGEEQSTCKDL